MHARNQVLLVIGVVMFAKAILALARPETLRRMTEWWLRTVKHVNTLTGLLCMAAGVAIVCLVLFPQPLVNWALGIVGILLIYGGSLYLRMAACRRVAEVLVLKRRSVVIRLAGAAGALIAAWLVWLAITG